MENLIAKRYIKALKDGSENTFMGNVTTVFSALAESFKDEKFIQIIDNPNVSMSNKSDILLAAVKSAKSEKINNLIKLLVEKKRINIIPAIAEALRKDVALSTKTYEGIIYSNSDIDAKKITELSAGLSKKFDSKISLVFVKNDFDGIKVDVEDLGIEINFSKTRINNQLVEYIIKAI
jgi:F-type H+-transporting ATPase subunit delta